MKKIIFILTLSMSALSFADVTTVCLPTSGVNQVGGQDFSKFSATVCKKYKTVESCSSDFRCTSVKLEKKQVCETVSIIEDAETGHEVYVNRDGTVGYSTY